MAEIRWTQSQQNAIEARDSILLVSAAAGSGKTAVLAERVARILADESRPVPADKMLIVTFSNAAATEMRERIDSKLTALIEENPSNEYLRTQQFLLSGAVIGTIHSFCLRLLRENFQYLDLSAELRVGDERELQVIKKEILANVIAEQYEANNPNFYHTVELFSSARSDEKLLKTILKLYDFTRSHPFPNEWLKEKLQQYQFDGRIGETMWGKQLLNYAQNALMFSLNELERGAALMKGDEKLERAYLEAFQDDILHLQRILEAVESNNWDKSVMLLQNYQPQKLRPLRGYEDMDRKKQVSDIRKGVKDLVEKLRTKQFSALEVQVQGDIGDLQPKIQILFDIVQKFSEQYDAAKRERQYVDFSDLEQYAIQLLYSSGTYGEHEITSLARDLKANYENILIDEYQDTNEAQEMIFTAIGRLDNLFMVGDVKQSIYGFRQANPGIFTAKKEQYEYYQGGRQPSKIILSANFRSHPAICHGINSLFTSCMSKEVGDIEYNSDERLIPLRSFPENPAAGLSLEFLDTSVANLDSVRCEAQYVANRVLEMLENNVKITENGELRPIRPGDIGILLRSMKGTAAIFLEEFARCGIPAYSGAQSTFTSTLEISTALSILQAVSNPLLDVPLVAAMMSPIYAASAGDVARIRLYKKDSPYYLALVQGKEVGDRFCERFINDLQYLRKEATRGGTYRFLNILLNYTGLLSIVSALDNPEGRSANLRLLLEYAKNYERSGYRTISQFLSFIDRLKESRGDLEPANLSGLQHESVQIMSIHHSKGLEFPAVFICGCFKRFNREDLRQNVLLHSKLGFACVRRDEDTLSQYSTIPFEAVKLAVEQELAGEEMRILYVAMTRAREILIVTGSRDSLSSRCSSLNVGRDQNHRLPTHAVARAQCFGDWILMWALTSSDGRPLREYAGIPEDNLDSIEKGVFRCKVQVYSPQEILNDLSTKKQIFLAHPSLQLLEQLNQKMELKYSYPNAINLPTKIAVTGLLEEKERAQNQLFQKRPEFITRKGITAALRGDAFHKYMLFADHLLASQNCAEEITRLVQKEFLSLQEAQALSLKDIQGFYQNSLFQRMMNCNHVEREYRFIAQLGKESDVLLSQYPDIDDETITVQGICDLLLIESDGAVIVDYKTDHVDCPEELIRRYTRQLELYAALVRRSLEIPIKECLIYSTVLQKVIDIRQSFPG